MIEDTAGIFTPANAKLSLLLCFARVSLDASCQDAAASLKSAVLCSYTSLISVSTKTGKGQRQNLKRKNTFYSKTP